MDYVDQHMDIPRLVAMGNYWQKHPPVHLMVAAYLGIKPEVKAKASDTLNTEQDLEEFMQMFSAAGGAIG